MFATWELAQHPENQAKLRRELCEAFPDPLEPLSFEKLEKPPYLDCVCQEGLLIPGATPSFLGRIGPEGGLNICGYSVPAGTTIGMQGYTNHRNEQVYPNAEAFLPERWFDPTPEMKLNFLPFSSGPRACIGLK